MIFMAILKPFSYLTNIFFLIPTLVYLYSLSYSCQLIFSSSKVFSSGYIAEPQGEFFYCKNFYVVHSFSFISKVFSNFLCDFFSEPLFVKDLLFNSYKFFNVPVFFFYLIPSFHSLSLEKTLCMISEFFLLLRCFVS